MPDFFFGQPRGWFALRGALLMPRAGGELFAFVSDQLTLSRSDFRAPAFNMELGFLMTGSLAVEAGLDVSRWSAFAIPWGYGPYAGWGGWGNWGWNGGGLYASATARNGIRERLRKRRPRRQ